MDQRELKAWLYVRDRALEGMANYWAYPDIQEKFNEYLDIIDDLLIKGK